MTFKKPIKIIVGIIVFLTLPSILFIGFLYFKYHEDLPIGTNPQQADVLAKKMLDALNYEAYENTNYIEWMYQKKRFYKWKKDRQTCTVYWKDYKVVLNLKDHSQSQAYVHNFNAQGQISEELIEKAFGYFKNDSFWLIAPYTVFDEGTERYVVNLINGNNGLLITYPQSDDAYLWHLDDTGKPKCLQLWTSSIPIDGLEMSWNAWTTTESGAQLATFHKLLFFGFELEDVKGTK